MSPETEQEPDQVALLARLRAGEERAYADLMQLAGPRMLAVARRFLRADQDAEDAVQDAFLQAFKNLDRFEGNAKLTTWLHRITVNASLMKLRKQKRTHEVNLEDLLPRYGDDGHRDRLVPEWTESGADVVSVGETRAAVRAAIDRLPDSYRNVLLLRDIEQLDTAETAELMGLSINATKTRLHRARQALREILEPHFSKEVSA
ncbi:MAG: RNA polymerase subunit sigma-24 [Planctomycetota bacterium]|nr:MAG: RNA polymerase subunit sigma-24 [Planctomycetota bacterium]